MKKSILLGLLIFLFGTVWAIDFHSHVDIVTGLVTEPAIAADKQHIQIGYGCEFASFSADAGFQLATESLSWAVDTSYQFVDKKHFGLFARGFFCMELMMNESFATDTFAGLKFFFPAGRVFSASIETMCGLKTSDIFALKDVDPLVNFDFAASVQFNWNIIESTQVYTTFTSYEMFYHPKFFAPILGTGVIHKFNDKFKGTVDFSVRTLDLVILSSYVEGFALRLKMEYTF